MAFGGVGWGWYLVGVEVVFGKAVDGIWWGSVGVVFGGG